MEAVGSDRLRGAMIGCGNVAVNGHLPGWLTRPDVEIVAVAETNPERRPEVAARLPQARWYESVDALLAGETLDFVDICAPPAAHAGLIRSALKRGLHVLCEKPLVCRMDELGELARMAEEAGKALYTVHNWHHAPIIRFVRDLLRQGTIGDVRHCAWEVLRTKPAVAGGEGGNWRLDPAMAGGGILVDHGWHAFYILHGWMGEAPARVSARLETRRHTGSPLEDTATVQLEFARATGEVHLTWAADERRTGAKVLGARGTIHVEDNAVALRAAGPRGAERRWTFPSALSDGSHHPDWFGEVAGEFVAGVRDKTLRSANLAEASLCAALLTTAQESSRQGGAWLPVGDARACVPMTDRLAVIQLGAGGDVKVLPGTILLGLPLVRRIVLVSERAGAGRVLVLAPDAEDARRLLEGTSALVVAPHEPLPRLPPGRIVLLAGNVLFREKWLRALFELPVERERLYAEASSVGVIETDDPCAVLSGETHGLTTRDVFASAARARPITPRTFPQEGRVVLSGTQDYRQAEDWLLHGLLKETEGFMSRHVERPISLAISRRLASSSVTPNAMTLFSVGVGLLGAPFFLSSTPAYQVTGALLFLLHSILDGCDGELARLKFQESRWGGMLDFWGDNVVHVAVFTCMGIGWSMAAHASWPLALGGAAVAGTLLSAGFVYWHTMRERAKPGPLFTSVTKSGRSWLSRMADALARRDFIYLVVLLAAAGKANWLLVLAGIGAPIFFLMLLAAAATEARREGRLTA